MSKSLLDCVQKAEKLMFFLLLGLIYLKNATINICIEYMNVDRHI